MAECSLSTGISSAPFSRTRGITTLPPQTNVSLLARAISLPASMAASVGARPTEPDTAHHHALRALVAGGEDEPLLTRRARFDAGALEQRAQPLRRRPLIDGGVPRAAFDGLPGQFFGAAVRRQGDDAHAKEAADVESLPPDAPGGAQYGHGRRHMPHLS